MRNKKVALVTGASGSIGSEIVKVFSKNSIDSVICYNSKSENAEKLFRSIEGDNLITKLDVTNLNDIKNVTETVNQKYGALDILVNCAGMTKFIKHENLDELNDELIDKILQVNVRSVIAMMRNFLYLLKKSENATVINISSIAAVTGMGSNIAYCASKAAVDNLTKSFARAFAPIRVVSLSPGLVDNEFIPNISDAWKNEQASKIALSRLTTAKEVALSALSIVNHLTYSTGCIIPVDGGRQLN